MSELKTEEQQGYESKGSQMKKESCNNCDIVKQMNHVLADYQLMQQKIHVSHWLVSGKDFLQLHAFYDELYEDILSKIDVVAEYIVGHGGMPLKTFGQYLEETCFNDEDYVLEIPDIIELYEHVVGELSTLFESTSEDKEWFDVNNWTGDFLQDHNKTLYKLKQLNK